MMPLPIHPASIFSHTSMTEDEPLSPESAIEKVNEYWENVQIPPLTSDQNEVVLEVLKSLKGNYTSSSALEGPAGTGKTTLLLGLIMAASAMDIQVEVAAFTHKACSVLAEKLASVEFDWPYDIPTPLTLHSLLHLVPKPPKFNTPQEFVQKKVPNMYRTRLLIVDECSMIGENLIEYILPLMDTQGVSVLFAGDPHQLRPVNEKTKSKTFTVAEHKYVLTEVLRHDGAILNLATLTRKMKCVPSVGNSKEGGGTKIIVHNGREDFEADWLSTLMEAEEVGKADSIIMLTYKNKTRAEYNRRARRALFGVDTPKFMEGDTVIALEPIIRGDQILFNNNEDISIVDKPILREDDRVLPHLDYTTNFWEFKTSKGYRILVLDDGHESDVKAYMKRLGKEIEMQVKAANSVTEQRNAKARWRDDYFALKEAFSNVDFRYALTVHKSQGSTYEHVYLNSDYRQGRDEATSLFYVGITRASSTVNLIKTGA
jgi:exodeoxyribonuclease-5